MRKVVVLLSGGLDSVSNLAFAALHDEVVMALTLNYGQKAFQKEKESAEKFANLFKVPFHVIEIPFFKEFTKNALTGTNAKLPELKRNELDQADITRESAKKVWVPNRNGVLINVAAAFAEKLGADAVLVGFNKEEAETFPDNTSEYMETLNKSFHYSTANGVKVDSYTVQMTKPEMVGQLQRQSWEKWDLGSFPFEWLWSCYTGDEKPCGQCESCQRLARALETA